MKSTSTRRGLRALVLIGSIVGVVTLGFAPAASAATTIGKAQTEIGGGTCTFGEGSVIQETSSGPSYTIPSAGTYRLVGAGGLLRGDGVARGVAP